MVNELNDNERGRVREVFVRAAGDKSKPYAGTALYSLAEVLWTYPSPARRDFAEFSARAAEHRRRMIANHINCAPLE